MSYCNDCGTRKAGDTCPNCHEEKYIYDNQWHEAPFELSQDFQDKVREQTKSIKDSKL